MDMENYFFDTEAEEETEYRDRKIFVLIIYDIVSNKRRTKFAKLLQGYGFRIQKSSFEAMIPKQKYRKLLSEIPPFVTEEDSVRIYKMHGSGEVIKYGRDDSVEVEDVIII